MLQIELKFCKFPELILQRNTCAVDYYFRHKQNANLLFNGSTRNASKIVGNTHKTRIMFAMSAGNANENYVDLIQFLNVLTISRSNKGPESN